MTAPDRIYAAPPHDDPEWESGSGEWDISDGWAVDGLTEYVNVSLYNEVVAQRDAAAARIVTLNKALQEAASILRREIVRTSEIYPEMDDRKRVVTLRAVTSEYAEIEKEILGILRREEVPLNLSA